MSRRLTPPGFHSKTGNSIMGTSDKTDAEKLPTAQSVQGAFFTPADDAPMEKDPPPGARGGKSAMSLEDHLKADKKRKERAAGTDHKASATVENDPPAKKRQKIGVKAGQSHTRGNYSRTAPNPFFNDAIASNGVSPSTTNNDSLSKKDHPLSGAGPNHVNDRMRPSGVKGIENDFERPHSTEALPSTAAEQQSGPAVKLGTPEKLLALDRERQRLAQESKDIMDKVSKERPDAPSEDNGAWRYGIGQGELDFEDMALFPGLEMMGSWEAESGESGGEQSKAGGKDTETSETEMHDSGNEAAAASARQSHLRKHNQKKRND